MTTYTATATKHITADVFVEAALAEEVKFHTVRSNGTTRRIRVLTGEEMEVAEWVMEQRESGVTMKDIAKEMSVSVPTVRRIINRYLLTEEVTEADMDEAAEWTELAEANREAAEAAKAEDKDEQPVDGTKEITEAAPTAE